MLTKPGHIAALRIADPVIRYRWNEWNVRAAYEPIDPQLCQRLQGLTRRSVTGFAIACGEWVAYRYEGLTDRDEPLDLLEAAWAANIDPAYSYPFETEDDEWRGPLLGPLNIMMALVVDALFGHEAIADPAQDACRLTALARHVLPDPAPFQRWQEACLARLHRHCTVTATAEAALLDETALDGDPVPRELYDPMFQFDPAQTATLIKAFLVPLASSQNPFLGTPEEMLDAGFVGTPYQWPARSDRDGGSDSWTC